MSAMREVENYDVPSGIPPFDGKAVDMAKIKILATSDMDCSDEVLRMDDIVHVLVEARVSQVHHNVNERNGHLIRLQALKPISVRVVPWNPESDQGVLHG